ncbi:cytochrome b [Sphingomonas nostoxanthinifaciens]|uniref:cytochrome b n=1 Tax=Sphingomonas nostoxanthinifaciens TaxID=2872652 RepID=UPI001CC1F6CF|nr:cytochrome b/b6 domain-containing protein [Sphingomonas nostoxanthinifaciens]UAK26194.1 cytochrome b/b6 domain-containing protein [Sphingomonas nostoxanthinifaciens]
MARATWDLGPAKAARYSDVAITLHWLIAIAILYNLASGLLRPVMPRGFFIFHISSGITILTLSIVRVLWRLTHRPPPLLPMAPWERGLAHTVHALLYAAMLLLPFSGWAMVSASPPAGSPGAAYADAERAAHEPVQPQVAPSGRETKGPPAPAGQGQGGGTPPRKHGPIMVWGLFKLPLITPVNEIGRTPEGVPQQRALHERIETFHLLGGWILLVLLVIHIGGALKHQLIDRQPELARMGLGRGRSWPR